MAGPYHDLLDLLRLDILLRDSNHTTAGLDPRHKL